MVWRGRRLSAHLRAEGNCGLRGGLGYLEQLVTGIVWCSGGGYRKLTYNGMDYINYNSSSCK